MAMEYGSGGDISVTMDGPFGDSGGGSSAKLVTIRANAADWKGGESPFSQVVAVDGVTVTSKVDVQLSEAQIRQFQDHIIAFQAANDTGIVTLYSYGSKPESDMEIQATITEVLGEGLILGNIFTTTNPQPDYGQDDPTKADYIKNKPTQAIEKAQATADSAKKTAEAALPKTGGTLTGPLDMDGKILSGLPLPASDTEAASKGYVDSRHFFREVALSVSGWTGTAAPYTQQVAVADILETDRPHFGPVYSKDNATMIAEMEAWSFIVDLETSDGYVVFTCPEEKPATALTIQMEVHR